MKKRVERRWTFNWNWCLRLWFALGTRTRSTERQRVNERPSALVRNLYRNGIFAFLFSGLYSNVTTLGKSHLHNVFVCVREIFINTNLVMLFFAYIVFALYFVPSFSLSSLLFASIHSLFWIVPSHSCFRFVSHSHMWCMCVVSNIIK